MPRARAALRPLVLLALVGPAIARAQDQPAPAPPPTQAAQTGENQPLDTSGFGDAAGAALDLFRGAAALGTVATCRTGSYGDEDPTLRGVAITGELLDAQDDVRALVEAGVPWTKKGRPYSEEACDAVRHVLDQLRYHAEVSEVIVKDGVSLTIKLAPQTLVRHIGVEGNLSVLGIFGGDFRPIFATDIERRLRLQPGSPISDDREERRLQLAEEEQRVVDYLSRRGHFDAEVAVTTKDEGNHQVSLTVRIDRGATYTVGQVKVVWRAGENQLDRQAALAATGLTEETIVNTVDQRLCPLFFCGRGRFSYDQLQEDRDRLRELLQKRGYPAVRVRIPYDPRLYVDRATKTVTLPIEVNLNKKLTVTFQGVENKSESNLRDVLTFDAANAADDFEAEASAEAIRGAYQADGRFQTVVSFERNRIEPTDTCPTCLPHDEIQFHVDEGPEQKIRGIYFQGNRAIPTATLMNDVINTKVFPTLPFSSGGYVTSVQLGQDLERVTAFYHALGFADVAVTARLGNSPDALGQMGAVSGQIAADDAGSGLYILFDVVEGQQQILESIGFAGNHALSGAELAKASQLQPGKPYTERTIAAAVTRIKDRYDALGYRYADVRDEVVGDGPRKRVTLTVIEGQKVTAGKILVRGDFKTAPWVVRDNFDLKTGDLFTGDALEKGRSNLRTTGLFTTVRSDVYPPPDRPGRDPANLILEVGERYDKFADLDVAAGLSTDNSVFGSLTVAMRNLGGIGIGLSATGELGLLRTAVQSSLVFPEWVMRRAVALPVRLELQGRYRVDQTPRFGALTTLGFTVSFSKQLARGVLLSFKYDWNRFGRTTELLRPAGNDQEIPPPPIDTTTAILGPTLLVDRRDNPLSPTRGYFLSAQVGVASTFLLGTDNFWKLDLAGQLFIPLGNRVVLTNSIRWDQGFPEGSAVLPEVERFSAGGDTTVRGYETDRLATEVIANPFAPAAGATSYRIVPIGKNIRVIHRLDFQLRLLDRVAQSFDIASALFLDSGLLTNSFADFDIAQVRQGVGMGIRIISAAGIISIEYAFPLQPRLGDDPTGRLHFVFGITI